MTVAVAVLSFGAGLAASVGLVHWGVRRRLGGVRAQAAARLEDVRARAVRRREEGAARARAEQERLAAFRKDKVERESAELAEYETEIDEREAVLASRERIVGETVAQLDAVVRSVEEARARTQGAEAGVRDLASRRTAELEGRAGQSAAEVREQLVREQVGKIELQSLIRLRESEEGLAEAAAAESRRVMQVACERYDGAGHLERVANTVLVPEPRVLALLATPDGSCRRAFVEEIGCDIVCDEAQQSVTVRGDDPLAREVARRVLRQLATIAICDADKVRTFAHQIRMEVEREVQNAGRKAARLLDVGRLHPDILHLVGRLKYRLSYSQNQWRHSIEVAHLAGMMAEELGLDVKAARRGGLLHDIGKAMTHDHDGSHAVLGAEVARRCGEDEIIANAVGSHHNDEPPRSPLAFIVTAADALSGGRPGARRESVTQYLNRIHDIQRIASRSPAVKRVDIMQAGREVRVVVAGSEHGAIEPAERHTGPLLTDGDLQPLAQQIARSIEQEITFPGQIKVTVIRESRSVAVAH